MYNEIFKDFKLESAVSPELIAKYEGVLPEDIVAIWKEYGFGTFWGGYLKMINPEEYVEILNDSYYAADKAVPMMMTAFGDLIVWEDEEYMMMIAYKNGDIECLSSRIHIFWRNMLNKSFLDKFFEFEQYNKAVSKLGELAFDECFGYTPLLGLGGKKKVENLEKVNAKVHIELITQMLGRIE